MEKKKEEICPWCGGKDDAQGGSFKEGVWECEGEAVCSCRKVLAAYLVEEGDFMGIYVNFKIKET